MKPGKTIGPNRPSTHPAPYLKLGHEKRVVYFFVLISTICHGIAFAALVFMPDMTPTRKIPYSVVSVRLVSLPAEEPAAQAVQKQAATKKTAVSEPSKKTTVAVPKPEQKTPKAVPVEKPAEKTKIIPKQSLKAKTFKSTKVLENTLTRLKKEVDESRPPSLEEAFDRLEQQVCCDEWLSMGWLGTASMTAAGS